MQLRRARVCLDCEEVHDAQSCPVCASEAFAFLSNWVHVEERRKTKRLRLVTILRPTWLQKVVFGSGVLGLLTFSVFRWARHLEEHALDRAGELR
jgi:hypothetical protein